MLGMLSKPIKDWIPEFPALHRLIIPGITNKDGEKQQESNHTHTHLNPITSALRVNHKRRTGPGAERCDYGHPTGQEAGISVLPEETQRHTHPTGENTTCMETQEPTQQHRRLKNIIVSVSEVRLSRSDCDKTWKRLHCVSVDL